MKVFVIISILACIGLSRGEAGYTYNRPYPVQNVVNPRPHPGVRGHVFQTIPQPQSNFQYNGYQQNSHNVNQVNTAFNSYVPPVVPQPAYTSQPKPFHNVGHLTSSQFIGATPNKIVNPGLDATSIESSHSNFEHVGQSHLQQSNFAQVSGLAPAPQEPIIKKHIYVHVPPPEPEPVRTQAHIAASQPRKNYKIVFIKLPSYAAEQARIQQALNRVEEKTLIYVLAKNPEETQAEINQVYAQRNKPEVYFIKYKAQTSPVAQPIPVPPLDQSNFGEDHHGAISLSNSIQTSSIGTSSSHQSIDGASSGDLGIGVSQSSSHSIQQPSPQYGPAHH